MSGFDRREFLKVGAGTVAGVALSDALPSFEIPKAEAQGIVTPYAFNIELGAISRIDASTHRAVSVSPWAVSQEFEPMVSRLLYPQAYNLETVETWAAHQSGEFPLTPPRRPQGSKRASEELEVEPVLPSPGELLADNPLDSLMRVSIAGSPNVVDIAGTGVLTLLERGTFDIDLEFMHPADLESLSRYHTANQLGIPVIRDISALNELSRLSVKDIGVQDDLSKDFDVGGWKLQVRGPETHTLGSCVRTPVKHFHFTIQRSRGRGRYDYVTNLHLGTYRSGGRRCFVLWNNYAPAVCWKTCSPTARELEEMIKWMLIAAAAVAGVAIAWWVVAAIAAVGAPALLIPLLVLA